MHPGIVGPSLPQAWYVITRTPNQSPEKPFTLRNAVKRNSQEPKATGGLASLLVMRFHDHTHCQDNLYVTSRPPCSSEVVHSRLGSWGTGPPGALQNQPEGHYWCEQRCDMVFHGRESQNDSGPVDRGYQKRRERKGA